MFVLILFVVMVSCNEKTSNTNEQTQQDTQTPQNQQSAETTENATPKTVFAIYEQATVYAGRTDYMFEDENGEMLMVEYSNFEETPSIELTENMLETDENLEGPPGANPEMVGKKFKLSYNADGQVFKIELAE